MRKLVTALALAACAAPALAGEPDATYASDKAPHAIAACLDDLLRATKAKPNRDGSFTVSRKNGFGMTMVRWEIRPTPTGGSAIDFHDKIGINTGRDKALRCF